MHIDLPVPDNVDCTLDSGSGSQRMPSSIKEIHLDNNATTPVLPQAITAARLAMDACFGNPSSTHCAGLRAKALLDSVRERASRVLGAGAGRVLFVSGATEGIQTAVLSALCHVKLHLEQGGLSPALLLYGATEHKAVPESLHHWNRILGLNCTIKAIPVDARGRHDLDFLRTHAPGASLVCTMAVNNETGVISDLTGIEKTLAACGSQALWLVDGVQALGKLTLNLSHTRIDYAVFSGHKLYAPKGIGLLYVRSGAPFTPLVMGGGQESGWRSGTENMAGIAAFGAIFEILENHDPVFQPETVLFAFRDQLLAALTDVLPQLTINAPLDGAVPTTINFSVPGLASHELLDLFDAAGIRVSSGSACSASKGTPSYVLQAMGLPDERAAAAVRMSFGPATTQEEIDAACARIRACGAALHRSCLTSVLHHDSQLRDGLMQLGGDGDCTWLLADVASRSCVIIDPIAKLTDRIENYVRCQNLRVLAVLDTHGHADHDSSRGALVAAVADKLMFDPDQVDHLGWPHQGWAEVELANGERVPALSLGSLVIARTAAPGHTADSVAYLAGSLTEAGQMAAEAVRYAFTGDTILMNSLGRTDFTTSSAPAMYASLRKLAGILGWHSLICPTHDYQNNLATTLAAECRGNLLLARVLDTVTPMPLEVFLEEKAKMDARLQDVKSTVLMCGAISSACTQTQEVQIQPEGLQDFLHRKPDALLVDVREFHEHSFLDWPATELDVVNVPLNRLAGNLGRWLQETKRPLLFFCRSGKRGEVAANCLRRLGYADAWNLAGGVALAG